MSETFNHSNLAVLHRELKKGTKLKKRTRLCGSMRTGRLAIGEMKVGPPKEGEDPRREGMRKSRTSPYFAQQVYVERALCRVLPRG